jgi:hypothetical protein
MNAEQIRSLALSDEEIDVIVNNLFLARGAARLRLRGLIPVDRVIAAFCAEPIDIVAKFFDTPDMPCMAEIDNRGDPEPEDL